MNYIEWIGYVASGLILLSMLMSSVIKLRIINLVGCLFFAAYGWMIAAYPVAVVNFIIAIVNIIYLRKMFSRSEAFFSVLETDYENTYFREFVEFNRKDISKFIPGFSFEENQNNENWLLLQDMNVAGIFIGTNLGDGKLEVKLDYILAPYRDFSLGKYLYQKRKDLFHSKGYNKLIVSPETKEHNKYLEKMGFQKNGDHYEREI